MRIGDKVNGDSVKLANKSFQVLEEFEYLGMAMKNNGDEQQGKFVI